MISMKQAIKNFFTHYFDFKGRATRAEFWWITLLRMVLVFMWSEIADWLLIDVTINAAAIWQMIGLILVLLLLIPTLSQAFRRLRDTGMRTGWVWIVQIILPLGIGLLSDLWDADLMTWVYLFLYFVVVCLPTNALVNVRWVGKKTDNVNG